MKRIYTLLFFIAFTGISLFGQTRYLEPIFEDVDVVENIVYGTNVTVLTVPVTGAPSVQPLVMDMYTPSGDTETNRPIITLWHTGNFLPALVNGQISGTKQDAYIVELATRLAKLGYVVVTPDYRQGWDPLNPSQEVRTNTLINAAYRGVQDSRVCARFLRKSVAEEDNPYGIDPDKIVAWGAGTGSYITLATTTLDQYEDLLLPKFIGSDITGDGNPDPMVIEFIHGDADALTEGVDPTTGTVLCMVNHPGYESDYQLCVNMGGAMGDISWLDETDPPIISFHVPTDPFAPYGTGVLIVPTTGDLVVEVSGSRDIQEKATSLGVNDVFAAGIYDDEFTATAAEDNEGFDGLFPCDRPSWPDADGNLNALESGPWEFWDADFWSMSQPQQCADNGVPLDQCNWHLVSLGSNPDMSVEKASAYMDTIVGFYGPRACLALGLENCEWIFTDSEEELVNYNVTLSPNPSSDQFIIETNDNQMEAVAILNIQGQVVETFNNVQSNVYKVNASQLSTGMYIARIKFKDGAQAVKFSVE